MPKKRGTELPFTPASRLEEGFTWEKNLSCLILSRLKIVLSLPRRIKTQQLQRWAVNMSNSTGATQSECKLAGCILTQRLTPCFRLSLAWSATSDTITKAAATQTEKEKERVLELGTVSLALTQQPGTDTAACKCARVCQHKACRFTLSVLVFFGIRREVVQVIWRNQREDMKTRQGKTRLNLNLQVWSIYSCLAITSGTNETVSLSPTFAKIHTVENEWWTPDSPSPV